MRTRSTFVQLSAVLLTATLLLAAGCQSAAPTTSASTTTHAVTAASTLDAASTAPIDAPSATMVVHGLGCPLCAHNIDEQLRAIRGVRDATVDLGTGSIAVELADASRPSPAQLARAVTNSGFTLVSISTP